MKTSYKKSGMTLIEIVVSLALLGIITVVVLGLFINGFKMIVRSGEREKTKVAATSSMDNLLSDISYSDADVTVADGSVTINYPDLSTKTITGKDIKINKSADGSQVEIKGFIP